VYIAGVDVSAGAPDAKLYFRLDPRRALAMLDARGDAAPLFAVSEDIVFQRCIRRPTRSQVYLHMKDAAPLGPWLSKHGLGAALEGARAVSAHLRGAAILPRIVSLRCHEDRRLGLDAATVYFHLERAR
jgi:hypothetical protein